MQAIEHLTVYHNADEVGTLGFSPDGYCTCFHYCSSWLRRGFSLSPLELPLEDKTFIAKARPFGGGFAVFEDSLPDGYGRLLLDRLLAGAGRSFDSLSPLQRLSIVGSNGLGALRYAPMTKLAKDNSLSPVDYEQMQQEALSVLSGGEGNSERLYLSSGNSGGCRPKCIVKNSDGRWIVKLRQSYDPVWVGRMEYEYNACARACGIRVPDFRLINGKYFASRRFDIAEDGSRIHTLTAAALLGIDIGSAVVDYRDLLSLTGYLTQSPAEVERMFSLMAFNVLSGNKDDHAKNFSFQCTNENGWTLAPAYDLTLSEGMRGEHATLVGGKGNPNKDDLVRIGTGIRMAESKCWDIIAAIEPKVMELKRKIDEIQKPKANGEGM